MSMKSIYLLYTLVVIILGSLEYICAKHRRQGKRLKWAENAAYWWWFIVALELSDITCRCIHDERFITSLIVFALWIFPVEGLKRVVRRLFHRILG